MTLSIATKAVCFLSPFSGLPSIDTLEQAVPWHCNFLSIMLCGVVYGHTAIAMMRAHVHTLTHMHREQAHTHTHTQVHIN